MKVELRVMPEFKKPNTVTGNENRTTVLNRLGLTSEVVKPAPKYVILNGVPHKIVEGRYIPLTPKA